MINAPQLLSDLTRLLKRLEGDLLQRIEEVPELKTSLQAEWQAARDADRCAETFETWADQVITQAGVHWLLSSVFLRFIEDNHLVDRPWLGGTPESGRLALVRDRHEAYFQAHPLENDRDYLLAAFREAGTLPGLSTFFDEAHNPAFRLGISGDAAMALMKFWWEVDADTGALWHDFTDPAWNTRFLGDLYQDLSEATRKRYALLQTPEFVEEFILDRTLTPAIREFGYREARLIDPTCGSGHFLLGGFHRFLAEWQRNEPGRNAVDMAQKALDAVAGVDLNPFAVAISRFRLFVAALQASGVQRLVNAHDFKVSVAIGDSLLHGTRFGLTQSQELFDAAESHADAGLAHAYASEDLAEVQRILGRQYHAVVGNPPYIVVKDAALNAAYRRKYASCHMKYSLGAPFTERFFELALSAREGHGAGFVGLITANSFMKREFGSRLIEQVLPRLDLTHVVDTSGAFIPGHGTPTVILFGRHRQPVDAGIRTVMGIKGEPSTPDDPAHGLVWRAIVGQIDQASSESDFVSVADTLRATFAKHPWSIGGGGAAEVKEQIEGTSATLGSLAESIGFASFTGTDEVFNAPASALRRKGFPEQSIRTFVVGDAVRDYQIGADDFSFAPYHADLSPFDLDPDSPWGRAMWPYRASLEGVISFGGKTRKECGDQWWTWYRWVPSKYREPLTITFAEVATHNHFVLDRGGKVFKQTAPVIKLPAGSSEDEHLGLLGLLNSSVACFWMKQVSHQKQMMGGDGIRISEKSKVPYQFASTRLQELPLPENWALHPLKERLIELAREVDRLSQLNSSLQATQVLERCNASGNDLSQAWAQALADRRAARSKSILLQEEIDFVCYAMYGMTSTPNLLADPLAWDVMVEAGCRPFCILGQRNVEGFEVSASIPSDWPDDMRTVWANRMQTIADSAALRTIEEPHYKRRWIGRQGLFNHGAKANEFADALRVWMLARLEAPSLWPASTNQPPQLISTSRLADAVSRDAEFMKIAALYAGHTDYDLPQLVADLVAAESVPALPVQRYTDTGLRKRAQWQDTWELQRSEDAIDAQVVAANTDSWREEFSSDARQRFRIAADQPLGDEAQSWVAQQLAAEIKRHQDERKDWELGKFRGKLRQGKDPQWLRETPDGWEFIPERVEALRRAVALYLAGQSGQDIAAKLAAEGISPFNGLLSSAHFYKVVKNPNLIGVKTVVVETEDVRGEFALKEYYPAVLSATEWDDLQAVNGQRGRRGAKSTIPHIITGLGITYCGYCGCAMSGQHLFGKIKNHGDKLKDGYRRLLCAAKQYGKACPHPVSRSVAPVERAIMNYCSDILNLRALYGGDRSAPLRVQLKAQRQRAGEIAEQSGNLMNAILSASSGVAPSLLVEKMSELETEKRTLERAMAHTEAQISALTRNDVNGVQAKWAELAKGVQELDYDARLQAKQLVVDTFERIVVYSTGVRPDDENRFTDVVLLAKGGASRMLRVDKSGAWQALEDVHRDAQDVVAA